MTKWEKKLWFLCCFFPKENGNWIVSKPLPSVQLNNKQNKINFLILKTTVCMQGFICVRSYIEWMILKVCQKRKYYWFFKKQSIWYVKIISKFKLKNLFYFFLLAKQHSLLASGEISYKLKFTLKISKFFENWQNFIT